MEKIKYASLKSSLQTSIMKNKIKTLSLNGKNIFVNTLIAP